MCCAQKVWPTGCVEAVQARLSNLHDSTRQQKLSYTTSTTGLQFVKQARAKSESSACKC